MLGTNPPPSKDPSTTYKALLDLPTPSPAVYQYLPPLRTSAAAVPKSGPASGQGAESPNNSSRQLLRGAPTLSLPEGLGSSPASRPADSPYPALEEGTQATSTFSEQAIVLTVPALAPVPRGSSLPDTGQRPLDRPTANNLPSSMPGIGFAELPLLPSERAIAAGLLRPETLNPDEILPEAFADLPDTMSSGGAGPLGAESHVVPSKPSQTFPALQLVSPGPGPTSSSPSQHGGSTSAASEAPSGLEIGQMSPSLGPGTSEDAFSDWPLTSASAPDEGHALLQTPDQSTAQFSQRKSPGRDGTILTFKPLSNSPSMASGDDREPQAGPPAVEDVTSDVLLKDPSDEAASNEASAPDPSAGVRTAVLGPSASSNVQALAGSMESGLPGLRVTPTNPQPTLNKEPTLTIVPASRVDRPGNNTAEVQASPVPFWPLPDTSTLDYAPFGVHIWKRGDLSEAAAPDADSQPFSLPPLPSPASDTARPVQALSPEEAPAAAPEISSDGPGDPWVGFRTTGKSSSLTQEEPSSAPAAPVSSVESPAGVAGPDQESPSENNTDASDPRLLTGSPAEAPVDVAHEPAPAVWPLLDAATRPPVDLVAESPTFDRDEPATPAPVSAPATAPAQEEAERFPTSAMAGPSESRSSNEAASSAEPARSVRTVGMAGAESPSASGTIDLTEPPLDSMADAGEAHGVSVGTRENEMVAAAAPGSASAPWAGPLVADAPASAPSSEFVFPHNERWHVVDGNVAATGPAVEGSPGTSSGQPSPSLAAWGSPRVAPTGDTAPLPSTEDGSHAAGPGEFQAGDMDALQLGGGYPGEALPPMDAWEAAAPDAAPVGTMQEDAGSLPPEEAGTPAPAAAFAPEAAAPVPVEEDLVPRPPGGSQGPSLADEPSSTESQQSRWSLKVPTTDRQAVSAPSMATSRNMAMTKEQEPGYSGWAFSRHSQPMAMDSRSSEVAWDIETGVGSPPSAPPQIGELAPVPGPSSAILSERLMESGPGAPAPAAAPAIGLPAAPQPSTAAPALKDGSDAAPSESFLAAGPVQEPAAGPDQDDSGTDPQTSATEKKLSQAPGPVPDRGAPLAHPAPVPAPEGEAPVPDAAFAIGLASRTPPASAPELYELAAVVPSYAPAPDTSQSVSAPPHEGIDLAATDGAPEPSEQAAGPVAAAPAPDVHSHADGNYAPAPAPAQPTSSPVEAVPMVGIPAAAPASSPIAPESLSPVQDADILTAPAPGPAMNDEESAPAAAPLPTGETASRPRASPSLAPSPDEQAYEGANADFSPLASPDERDKPPSGGGLIELAKVAPAPEHLEASSPQQENIAESSSRPGPVSGPEAIERPSAMPLSQPPAQPPSSSPLEAASANENTARDEGTYADAPAEAPEADEMDMPLAQSPTDVGLPARMPGPAQAEAPTNPSERVSPSRGSREDGVSGSPQQSITSGADLEAAAPVALDVSSGESQEEAQRPSVGLGAPAHAPALSPAGEEHVLAEGKPVLSWPHPELLESPSRAEFVAAAASRTLVRSAPPSALLAEPAGSPHSAPAPAAAPQASSPVEALDRPALDDGAAGGPVPEQGIANSPALDLAAGAGGPAAAPSTSAGPAEESPTESVLAPAAAAPQQAPVLGVPPVSAPGLQVALPGSAAQSPVPDVSAAPQASAPAMESELEAVLATAGSALHAEGEQEAAAPEFDPAQSSAPESGLEDESPATGGGQPSSGPAPSLPDSLGLGQGSPQPSSPAVDAAAPASETEALTEAAAPDGSTVSRAALGPRAPTYVDLAAPEPATSGEGLSSWLAPVADGPEAHATPSNTDSPWSDTTQPTELSQGLIDGVGSPTWPRSEAPSSVPEAEPEVATPAVSDAGLHGVEGAGPGPSGGMTAPSPGTAVLASPAEYWETLQVRVDESPPGGVLPHPSSCPRWRCELSVTCAFPPSPNASLSCPTSPF